MSQKQRKARNGGGTPSTTNSFQNLKLPDIKDLVKETTKALQEQRPAQRERSGCGCGF